MNAKQMENESRLTALNYGYRDPVLFYKTSPFLLGAIFKVPPQTNIFMSRKLQRLRDHDINPCLVEADASSKCMDKNNYNRDACTLYFLRYKSCKKFWNGIVMQRRKDGIKPDMPTAEEREKILASIGRIPY
ncbi:coiled-coil-helix-coiled-coil-helix domain-containing protein 7 isoform X2 [Lacerta agilis]|uniref:coiled-coil-helix-coiled-coil-helix domain-containing protein 7 isoform X2 n=1 Tax=Lacerta agilis TaxID=80427 RepID=UPI001419EDD3|nr:coiled-coil-helix-coiled-coil-helix domain-containing protein 7 isoform X2 [Lacerta agilis]